uniref:Uncharacterized protein n=1 Tax=Mucochytrium quahogii TaxID=96639 RepID=A0A7S2RHK4_9STRA|mmetsp:Transcript_19765/g.32477  ORF Transcript_19765/g.32477 Transcript_19765/m.32477 type:complete len:836 (+) Transcript_19765:116-2623(+)
MMVQLVGVFFCVVLSQVGLPPRVAAELVAGKEQAEEVVKNEPGAAARDALIGQEEKATIDAVDGLEMRDFSVLEAVDALEKVGFDQSLAKNVRGAAITQLALAHENVFPSFATKEASSKGSTSVSSASYSHTMADNPILNRTRAVELYRLGAKLGNETAQFRMGTLYATGALGVKRDPVTMLLHYYFSALGGHTGAQMALGFRHSLGLGTPKNCNTAVMYYELAANAAVDLMEMNGVASLSEKERLSLDKKSRGIIGRGSARGEDEDVVDYYKHAAEKGDVTALVALGQIHFYGARGVERDAAMAVHYFRLAAATGDPTAQTSLGYMLAKGMGTEQDVDAAFKNFTSAAEAGSAGALNGLGYLYLYGLGVKQDSTKALRYFNDAAEQGNSEAYYNLGALYVSGVGVRRRNYNSAVKYFTLATQKGHTLAMHKLAQMNLHAIGTRKNCNHALQLFKEVAERGDIVRLLSRGFSYWNNDDDPESALQMYLVASELGYEVAQSNAAWLLESGADIRGGIKPEPVEGQEQVGDEKENEEKEKPEVEEVDELAEVIGTLMALGYEYLSAMFPEMATVRGSEDALRLYELAAEQGNVEARLKIGDFYYYGMGELKDPNFELAAEHYKQASNLHNAQAMFNLGFMHQHGIGLPRDFPLAKRYYDKAETTSSDARVPVSLALTSLWLHRVQRAILYKENTNDFDLPYVVDIVGEFARKWFPVDDSNKEQVPATDSSSGGADDVNQKQVPATGSSSGGTKETITTEDAIDGDGASSSSFFSANGAAAAYDEAFNYVNELEDDTIVAIVLFMLLVLVLLMRSREQHRRHMQQIQTQGREPHPHQD